MEMGPEFPPRGALAIRKGSEFRRSPVGGLAQNRTPLGSQGTVQPSSGVAEGRVPAGLATSRGKSEVLSILS